MLSGRGGNRGSGRKQRQPTAEFMASVTCRLTAEDWDKLRNPTLDKVKGSPILEMTRNGVQSSCGLRPSVLRQDQLETKNNRSWSCTHWSYILVLVLHRWCCVVKNDLVMLVVISSMGLPFTLSVVQPTVSKYQRLTLCNKGKFQSSWCVALDSMNVPYETVREFESRRKT